VIYRFPLTAAVVESKGVHNGLGMSLVWGTNNGVVMTRKHLGWWPFGRPRR